MRVWPGSPYPLGATFDGAGTNFALYLNGSGIRCSDLTGSLMTDSDFLLCFNASPDPVAFVLPPAVYTPCWSVAVDTADVHGPVRLQPGEKIIAEAHSMLVLREPVEPVHAPDRHDTAHRPPQTL